MYDLIVIGSGPGGYEVAIKAKKEGLNVALIEKHEIGGTCLNYGCIPTKTLYQSAKLIRELEEVSEYGIQIENQSFDVGKIQSRKGDVVSFLKNNINTALKKTGVDVYLGEATFASKTSLTINLNNGEQETLLFKHCIIASGSKEVIIPIPGHDLDHVLSSKEMMSLEEVPSDLVIIGGGVIGCEMASIYRSMGANVTIVEALDRILNNFDKDISTRLKSMMKKQGIKINTSTKVTGIEKDESGQLQVKCLDKKERDVSFDASHVLMSVGRRAVTDGLNLEDVGIDFDKFGIKVNEHFMTSVDHVYAVGDCIGGMMLAHTATYQSYAALDHILGKESEINFDVTPACVFVFPEIASVGLTEEEAKSKYDTIQVSKSLYRGNGKANAMGAVDGFIKLVTTHDRLVGAHIIGEAASTIIHEASLIIANELDIEACVSSIHAHPTLSEVLLEALRSLVE